MHRWYVLHGISKVPFEIPYKISYPYIERYASLKLLDLRVRKRFWSAPSRCYSLSYVHAHILKWPETTQLLVNSRRRQTTPKIHVIYGRHINENCWSIIVSGKVDGSNWELSILDILKSPMFGIIGLNVHVTMTFNGWLAVEWINTQILDDKTSYPQISGFERHTIWNKYVE